MKDRIKEYGIASLKGLIGAVPFAGTFLNEIAFEARSRLKQDRVNQFIIHFQEFMNDKTEDDLELDEIDKEEFSDIFEEILISVSKTSAQHKIEIFKQILLRQLTAKRTENDLAEKYVNITNGLSNTQFEILHQFSKLSDNLLRNRVQILEMEKALLMTREHLQGEIILSRRGYENSVELFEKRIKYINKLLSRKKNAISKTVNPNYHKLYSISHEEFLSEMYSLISKGLMYDLAISSDMIRPNEFFIITKLGRQFIEFVSAE